MAKHLLLLASAFTYRAKAFEDAAQRLGIPVIRGEDVPPPLIGKVRRPLPLDYRDIPRSAALIERFAQTTPIGAILGLDDSGTLLAAAASERIDLPHNSPDATLAARDKHLMRQKFAQAGVPSPNFHHHFLDEDLPAIAARTRYPCVIKPTTLAGSRGVMRANNPTEFLARAARLRAILATEPCQEFLVEDFIPGVEVALEGLMDYGKLHILALFDKPDPLDGPFFEETIYVTPSRLPAATQTAITQVAERAAAALGLVTGPIHAELRINLDGSRLSGGLAKLKPADDERTLSGGESGGFAKSNPADDERTLSGGESGGFAKSKPADDERTLSGGESGGFAKSNPAVEGPIMVEIAARSIGGSCSKTLRFDLDTSLEELIIRQAFQLPLTNHESLTTSSGVMMIPIPRTGLLTRLDGLEAASRVPLITEIEITAQLNQRIKAIPEGDSYLGFIFARGDSPAAVESALRQAHSLLKIEIIEELQLIP
ncbi:MAG: hypothetical protein Fur0022_43420 [Anaerolineales bacterium]